jgi:hypothetical protein
MMEYLLTTPAFAIQFAENSIIAWRQKRFAPDDFQAAVDLIAGVLDRLPEDVVRQQEGQ